MNILGINEGHMSSASLIKNGQLIAAVCEERFTRNKNEQGYPENAINYCLNEGQISKDDIDLVATATLELPSIFESTKRYSSFSIDDYVRENNEYWKPKLLEGKEVNYFELFKQTPNKFYDFSYMKTQPPEEWNSLFKKERIKNIVEKLGISEEKITVVDHHTGHAYYAYFMSPFRENVVVITADAWGDDSNGSVWLGNGNSLELQFKTQNNTLARIYRNITLLLGMKPNEHEYKMMGLAPYATDYQIEKPYKVFEKTLYVEGIDFKYHEKPSDNYFWFKDRLEGTRFDGIAGAVQKFSEHIMSTWTNNVLSKFNFSTVVLSGGLALNIKINQKISELDKVKNLFVPSAGGDESQSIGAALYVLKKYDSSNNFKTPLHDYHGPDIDYENLDPFLSKQEISEHFEIEKQVTNKQIAELLSKDFVIARCVGRSEFGPRALGNRSILANPSKIENLKKINTQIKYRDFWMPFTPSILEERIDDYAQNPKNIYSPFMTIAFDSTPLAKTELIAALHPSDFTLRPQFVRKSINSEYHELIKEFEKITGIGGLLNTSLNLHGEPVVGTVQDAIHTLLNSNLDGMLINNTLLIRKSK